MVTPLRDILKRTTCASARSTAHDPAARTVELSTPTRARREELRYDQLLVAVGSVSRSLPVPGLDEHAIGFKSLADAIWLRNHVIETLEARERDRGPGAPRGAADLRLRRRRLRGPRGARRAPGLRRRRDGPLPARPPARDALDPGRGHRPGAARGRPRPRRLRGRASCAGAASTSGSAPASRRPEPTRRRLSTGERIPTRTIVWTAGVAPAPEPRGRWRCRSTSAAGCEVDEYMRVEGMDGVWAIGDCAAVPDPDQRRAGRLPADRSARGPPGAGRSAHNIAAELGVGDRPAPFDVPRPRRRSSTSAATRRSASSAGSRSAASRPGGWRAPTT